MQNYVESFFLDIRRHTSPFKPLCLWYCRKVVCYKPRQLQVTTFTPHRFQFLPGNFLTQCYMASHHPLTEVVCRGNSRVTDAFVCEFWFRSGLRSNQHNLWKEKEFVKSVRWWSLVDHVDDCRGFRWAYIFCRQSRRYKWWFNNKKSKESDLNTFESSEFQYMYIG